MSCKEVNYKTLRIYLEFGSWETTNRVSKKLRMRSVI